ncbi:hypothetical protein [Gluconobacter albidus]|uniref:hypothetical protein n=1 Tax=Gluconobacter albidus TaxID=318683 RepID=UPI0012E90BA1|nr:hypothetical protein [Gluconobacter albidus]
MRRVLIEDRRWYVLDAIAQMADRRLNEEIILIGIRDAGRPAQVTDVRADLEYLEREGCVTLERYIRGPGRQYWIATLTAEGLQARDNLRTIPGVAQLRPL